MPLTQEIRARAEYAALVTLSGVMQGRVPDAPPDLSVWLSGTPPIALADILA